MIPLRTEAAAARCPLPPELEVAAFNRAHDLGALVLYRREDGASLRLRTQTAACVIGFGGKRRAVIWLQGIEGCIPLARLAATAARRP